MIKRIFNKKANTQPSSIQCQAQQSECSSVPVLVVTDQVSDCSGNNLDEIVNANPTTTTGVLVSTEESIKGRLFKNAFNLTGICNVFEYFLI